jgi:hypothetical protein
MPNDILLLILEIGSVSPTAVRSALAAANGQPGFLIRAGASYRLIAEDELDGSRAIADLGAPVAVAGQPPGEARYMAFDIQDMDGGLLAAGVRVVGEARVRLKPPHRLGMVVGGQVVYRCPVGPHDVLAHRVQPGRKCPQHPSQTVDP